MATKRIMLAAACAGVVVSQAGAATVTFDFGNANTGNNSQNAGDGNWTPFADETTAISTSASITIGGVEMTISGTATDGNATADEFWGINNQGIGVITDGVGGAAGRRVDGTIGESITFSFDQDVDLTSLRLGSFQTTGGGANVDVVTVTPDGGATITFTSDATNAPTTDRSLGGVFVAAGTDIVFTTTSSAASGVLFNEITVETIPEPGSLALLGLGGLLIARRRRA